MKQGSKLSSNDATNEANYSAAAGASSSPSTTSSAANASFNSTKEKQKIAWLTVDIGRIADLFDRMILEMQPFFMVYQFVKHILRAGIVIIPGAVSISLLIILWFGHARRGSIPGILYDWDLVKAIDSYSETLRPPDKSLDVSDNSVRVHNNPYCHSIQISLIIGRNSVFQDFCCLGAHKLISCAFKIHFAIIIGHACLDGRTAYFCGNTLPLPFADTHLGRACRNVFIPSLPDVDISKEFQDIKPLLDNDDKSRTKSKTYWEEIHKEHQTALRSDTDTQHDSSNVSTDNSTDPSFQKKQRPDAITLGSTISKSNDTNVKNEYYDGNYVWVENSSSKGLQHHSDYTDSTNKSATLLQSAIHYRTVPASHLRAQSSSTSIAHDQSVGKQQQSPQNGTSTDKRTKSLCSQCNASFTLMRSRYDCSSCASPICSRCVVRVKKALFGVTGADKQTTVRVCTQCARVLQARAEPCLPMEHQIILSESTDGNTE
eukprot:gene9818-2011_t